MATKRHLLRKGLMITGLVCFLTAGLTAGGGSFFDWLWSLFPSASASDATFALHNPQKADLGTPDPIVSLKSFKKPTILVLWAVGCEPCLRELVVLNKLAPRIREQGADVVPVLMGSNWGGVVAFLTHMSRRSSSSGDRSWGDIFPHLGAYYDAHGEVGTRFNVRSVPIVVFLNANGKVIGRHEGYKQWDAPDGLQELDEKLGTQLTNAAAR